MNVTKIKKSFHFNEKFKSMIPFIIIYVLGLIFISFAAFNTSPFFKISVSDSAFLNQIAKGMIEGKILYKDYVDVKGPLYYFLLSIGQRMIDAKEGAFILECIAITFVSTMLFIICKQQKIKNVFIFIIAIAFFYLDYSYLWGGNMPEEYILGFNLSCFIVAYDYIKNNRRLIPYSIWFGVVVAFNFYSKATMAAPIGGFILCIVIYLISEKKYIDLLKCAISFIGGFLLITFPIVLYFYSKNALNDFYHCAIELAISRGGSHIQTSGWSQANNFECLFICLPIFIFFVITILNKKITKKDKFIYSLIFAGTLISALSFLFSAPESYYYSILATTIIPFMAIIFSWFNPKNVKENNVKKDKKNTNKETDSLDMLKWLSLVLVFIYLLVMIPVTTYNAKMFASILNSPSIEDRQDEVRKIMSYLPGGELEHTIDFSNYPLFYDLSGKTIESKYPVQVNRFLLMDEENVLNYLDSILEDENVHFMLSYYRSIGSSVLEQWVDDNFDRIIITSVGELYKRKGIEYNKNIENKDLYNAFFNVHGFRFEGKMAEMDYGPINENCSLKEKFIVNNPSNFLYEYIVSSKKNGDTNVQLCFDNNIIYLKTKDEILSTKISKSKYNSPSEAFYNLRIRPSTNFFMQLTTSPSYCSSSYAGTVFLEDGSLVDVVCGYCIDGIYYLGYIDKNTQKVIGGRLASNPNSLTEEDELYKNNELGVACEYTIKDETFDKPQWTNEAKEVSFEKIYSTIVRNYSQSINTIDIEEKSLLKQNINFPKQNKKE